MAEGKEVSTGTLLKLDISSVFTTVFSVTKIDGPDGEVIFDDLTDLSSTYVEDGEVVGLATPGSLKIDGYHSTDSPTHKAILDQITAPGSNKNKNWKIVDANAKEITFVGTAKSFKPMREAKKFKAYSLEIKLRAPATFPSAS